MNKKFLARLALIVVGSYAMTAGATTATSTFNVKLTVNGTCQIKTVPADIVLTAIVAGGAVTAGSTTINVNCSKGTAFNIGLQPSNNDTTGKGAMTAAGVSIPYQLRQTTAAGAIWGNTATASAVGNGLSGTGTGMTTVVPFTAFATVLTTDTDVVPGAYTDLVTVNVNY